MKILKKIGRVFLILLAVLLALFAVANLLSLLRREITKDPCPTVFGYAWAVVISGSMEPNIHVNDLVIIRAQEQYAVDDVVTYRGDGLPVTHRIISEHLDENGNLYFITKGDNNNTEDTETVYPDSIVGKVITTIPKFGYLQSFVQSPLGVITLASLLLAYFLLPDFIRKLKQKGQAPESTATNAEAQLQQLRKMLEAYQAEEEGKQAPLDTADDQNEATK